MVLMKRSSLSLQFLVVSSTSEVTISPRPRFRGGRGQCWRGYSDHPSRYNTDQFVTGDSHLQAVRNDNRRFSYPGSYLPGPQFYPEPRQFNPTPPEFNPRSPFYGSTPPLPFSQNQPFYRPPAPTFNQNQPFRPYPLLHRKQLTPRPPKPADYRDWEFAKSGPPINSERFTVVSYNILADYLAITHQRKLYYHIPHFILDWAWRKRKIIFELGLWSADVLCFQEVDKFHDLEKQLSHSGYNGIWKRRTGDHIDGCAIFWRVSRFKLRYEECIEFNKHGLRDNVAQICVLELTKKPNNQYVSAVPTSSEGSSKVVICNIHVLDNPKRGDIKLGQIRILLDRTHAISKLWDDAPVVICGDFNCTPKSPLYNFIMEQKLDLSKLPRDKISGQASAEIRPRRPFNPNLEAQPAYGSFRPPAAVEEKELRQNGSPLDGQNQNNPDDKRNIASRNSIPQFQAGGTDLDLKNISEDESVCRVSVSGSNDCPITAICEGGCPDDKVKDEIIELSLEEFKKEDTSSISKDEVALNVPVSGLNDCPISAHDGVHPTDEPKDGSCFTTPMESHCEDNFRNATRCRDGVCTRSSAKLSRSNSYTKNMNCNQGELVSAADRFGIHSVTDYDSVPDSENLFSLSAGDRNFSETSADVSVPYEPESNNFSLEEKFENLKLNKPVEATKEDGSLDEDYNKFLSELPNSGRSFPFKLSQFQGSLVDRPINKSLSNGLTGDSRSMDLETVDVERYTYDPSDWTTMEIEIATGTANCTFMEHPLKLSSTYAEVDAISATRDANGEPLVTSYNRCFSGTVDYIWRSEGLQTVRVLSPIPKEAMQWTPGFPTKKWGSDHIALVSELAFAKDMAIQNDQVQ